MRDPYQVLGVPSTATDDEVKKAYRDLARKYHPDNYHDNPLADLAQERMKEINEAYEEVQSQRKAARQGGGYTGGSYGGYGGSYGGAGYGNAGYGAGYGTGASRLQRVRAAITQGNLNLAEELLNAQTDHDAEWNYLKGAICTRRGWLDEARRRGGRTPTVPTATAPSPPAAATITTACACAALVCAAMRWACPFAFADNERATSFPILMKEMIEWSRV